MSDEYTIKTKLKKVVTIITIIVSMITLLSTALHFGLPFYLQYKFPTGGQAGSIGIIGGADGPTAIFISSSPSYAWMTLIFAILSVCGILYLIFSKKK